MTSAFSEVLDAARSGDEAAWSKLYDSVAGQMLGYLRGRGAQDPEGLVGDSFVQIARNLRGFHGDEAGFRSWAFTVAHHRLIDERRRLSRRPNETPISDDRLRYLEARDDVAFEAIEAIDHSAVTDLLDTLSDDQRNVVLMRVLGGLSTQETAAAIGKSEGSVRVLLHRALSALREQMNRGVTP